MVHGLIREGFGSVDEQAEALFEVGFQLDDVADLACCRIGGQGGQVREVAGFELVLDEVEGGAGLGAQRANGCGVDVLGCPHDVTVDVVVDDAQQVEFAAQAQRSAVQRGEVPLEVAQAVGTRGSTGDHLAGQRSSHPGVVQERASVLAGNLRDRLAPVVRQRNT
jgi:hypothetical protein